MDETMGLQPERPQGDRRRRLVLVGAACVLVMWCVAARYVAIGLGDVRHSYDLQAIIGPPPATDEDEQATQDPTGSVRSVVHSRTTPMPPLEGTPLEIREDPAGDKNGIITTTELFAQHGTATKGVHIQMKNSELLHEVSNRAQDSLLVVVVLHNNQSWGTERSVADFFTLVDSFSHPKAKTSITMLASDVDEFQRIQTAMEARIPLYSQLSLLFRSDFNVGSELTRDNRHEDRLQTTRRRMLARYRNYALLSTLETWHQHVVWLDADVSEVPPGLVTKMIQSGKDILEPICYQSNWEYDMNAWVGRRKTRPSDPAEAENFVPDALEVKRMNDYVSGPYEFIPLDSVGGTMLYVKADIHRQGVLFPHFHVIGNEWERDGYDGIETEGLCFEARFLGYKCWGMPHDAIRHV